jgi:hypothetical protein
MFCAAIPAAAAVGAKLNADQLHKETSQRLPIPKITAFFIGLLASATAHAAAFKPSRSVSLYL